MKISGLLTIMIVAMPFFLVGNAHALCVLSDKLVDKYGITFSGFQKDPPKQTPTDELPHAEEQLVSLRLWNKKGFVADGFEHEAIISKKRSLAWIVRFGGFASPQEWYGPVKIDNSELVGCKVEKASFVLTNR
jgi:hypothetical protein